MSEGREIWQRLLRVDEPWSVLEFEADPVSRCYKVVIGLETAKGWFNNGLKAAAPGFERVWRHVNFGDWNIIVHVMAPNGSNLSGLPWAGQPGLPFTHLLCQEIFTLLRDGMPSQAVAEHLRIAHDELWRFRQALDGGRWIPPLDRQGAGGGLEDEELPPLSSPIWFGLLDGTRDIDTRMLSLKLMLTKLRTELSGDANDAARKLTARELYGYFSRNKQSLESEIAQLKENG